MTVAALRPSGPSLPNLLNLLCIWLPTSRGASPGCNLIRTPRRRRRRLLRCFRSLPLVTCPYLYLTEALVPDLEPTRIGYAKFGGNILQQSNNFT
jgi:hypothetical protein